MNMDEFMSKLYGPTATQRLSGGSNESQEYANVVKLNRDTLGREIGGFKIITDTNMKGGVYEPPKSLSSILAEQLETIENMEGGARRKKRNVKKMSGSSAKSTKDYPIVSSFEYAADGTFCEEDARTFFDTFMLYYRISRSPSSAILIIPPHSEVQDLKKKFEKYCKDKFGGNTKGIEAENEIVSGTFQVWRNYLFYVFVKSDANGVEYRIDPLQNGASNSFPYDENSVSDLIFKRANLNSYIWFMKYDQKDKKFYLYPSEDLDNSKRIGLNFVAICKQGKYMFQAEKPIPNNTNNQLMTTKQSGNQVVDMMTINGGERVRKYPIKELISNWENYGLQKGSEIALCQMFKTSPSQVSQNLSGNIQHAAILSALDGVCPSDVSNEEISELTKQMKNSWRYRQAPIKSLQHLNKKLPYGELIKTVKRQYPEGTRETIMKADMIDALIGGGVNPELAFSALDYSVRGRADSERLAEALESKPFEFYNSMEHPPVFSCGTNEDKTAVKEIFSAEENSEVEQHKNENINEEPNDEQNNTVEDDNEEMELEDNETSESENDEQEGGLIPSGSDEEQEGGEEEENGNEDEDEETITGGKKRQKKRALRKRNFKAFY